MRTLPFSPLIGRQGLPSRSALSRFLASMDQETIDALRQHFERFSFASGWTLGDLTDRSRKRLLIFDVDGTRQVARLRRWPMFPESAAAHQRMAQVCSVSYPGRKAKLAPSLCVALAAGRTGVCHQMHQLASPASLCGASPPGVAFHCSGLWRDSRSPLDLFDVGELALDDQGLRVRVIIFWSRRISWDDSHSRRLF